MRGIGIIRSGFGLWCPMPEVFLEFIGDASPWLVPLLVVLAVWGKFNWAALNNPDKKASFERAVGWLREDSFGQLYLGFLGGLMDRVGEWIGDRQRLSQASMVMKPSKGLTQRVFGFNPFTAQSYEKCLWLAFMYPVFTYSLTWALGTEGLIGNISWLGHRESTLETWQRWGLILSILLPVWFISRWRSRKRWVVLGGLFLLFGKVSHWLGAGVFSFYIMFTFTIGLIAIGAFLGVKAFTSSIAIACIIFITRDSAAIFVILIAFSIAAIIRIILPALQKRSEATGNLGWFWLIYSAGLIILGAASLKLSVDSGYMLFTLLWLLLPLANAPLDWLSLGFTRGLLQAVRAGNHSGYRALIWAAADLLLAFIFLFLITAVLVGVTALGNAVAGKTLVNIGCILSNLKTDSASPDHWWIYFMLLSTLIPTLFHFALAGGAATLWLPRKWRTQLADGLQEDTHKTFGAWAYLTFTPVVGFILMPLALLGSLWWLLNTNSGALGTLLLNWATGLAQWADPAMMLSCSAG